MPRSSSVSVTHVPKSGMREREEGREKGGVEGGRDGGGERREKWRETG